ncbi:MAG: carbohydrate-binding module family 20 domain-containing protein [Actinomycetota bacterium]|nr:carbohydrate-binding module family 20 domain-containing protein [Actinomycetota bacterium]
MKMKRIAPLTVSLMAALVAVMVVGRPEHADAKADANPGAKDVIVHLFEWPWASIASECTNVLGPRGFGGVQVSPPQEHVVLPGAGYPWWQDYQPVSYKLQTRRGDRAAFANMVSTCHAAGVKIYVDAVINHMAGGASTGAGSAGSTYSHYSYPAVPFGNDDFHHCGRNGNDDIANWGDRWEIQNCELVDLSDLKTEAEYVRGKLVAYLNDLISLGVDGFRVDAAKHMPVADLQNIYSRLNGNPYIFQETIEGGAGEPSPSEYTGIGDVTEFRYGDVVGNAFRDGNLSGLQNLPSQMLLASGDAVAFIDNHDTQRNGRAKLTYKDGTNYALSEAFMLAYPYGTPAVMSSFTFSNPEAGPPASSNGTTNAVNCSSGWTCEHRWRTTANMVGFHNAAYGTGLTNWWSNGGNQIAFGRGANAYAVFNRGGTLNRTFSTSLPAGIYCDVANGDISGNTCTGTAYTVNSSGQFTANVPANGMVALHVNARVSGGVTTTPPTGCSTVAVTFASDTTTVWGENVFVLGDRAELSNWNTSGGVALSSATYPVWRGTVSLPANTAVEYKYVKKNGSTVTWESGGNRTLNTGTACTLTVNDTWRS